MVKMVKTVNPTEVNVVNTTLVNVVKTVKTVNPTEVNPYTYLWLIWLRRLMW